MASLSFGCGGFTKLGEDQMAKHKHASETDAMYNAPWQQEYVPTE